MGVRDKDFKNDVEYVAELVRSALWDIDYH